jgi:hypothetical protein
LLAIYPDSTYSYSIYALSAFFPPTFLDVES